MQNPQLDLAFDFVQFTNRNIFLTGKAGTGKTTFLHKLKEISPKRMVVVAPTGVAAINAGGVTIHSFFQMPFGPILPGRLNEPDNNRDAKNNFRKFNKRKINIIRTLDLLIIDEISMVRADLLDGIDQVLRRYKNRSKPFGGAQVLMIGDLQQLVPVVKENEWQLLRDYYETAYFFSSKVFQESNAITIELKHIYRQQDDEFIKVLNEIRDNKLTAESFRKLNERYIENFRPKEEEGYIILTTHNAIANRINEEQLAKVKSPEHTFEAEISGQFPEFSYPADQFLTLKQGAQVMFIKNDLNQEKRYYNGKIGKIVEIEDETIFVQCENEEQPIAVERAMWENTKYSINEATKAIEESVTGSFIQYPLRLAWAITIHKSQGLTFEKAVIDANAAFAHGQTYVALSRCKSLEGLVLSSKISPEGIICDSTIGQFNKNVEDHQPDDKVLAHSKQNFKLELLEELFSYRQLQYHMDKCRKQFDENKRTIQGDMGEKIGQILSTSIPHLLEVGNKFISQLKHLGQQETSEPQFQERIKKGAAYFAEKTETEILSLLRSAEFESDNTAIQTAITETLEKISELLKVKKACLLACKDGLDIKTFLNSRATAALEKPGKSPEVKTRISGKMSKHPVLYESLREWRHVLATDEGVPHYRILSQQALLGISDIVPGNDHQLLEIKGFGKMKLKQFGDDILEIVNRYCYEYNVEPKLAKAKAKAKPVKKDTKKISYELFMEGKTISEIAKIRSFAETTIEGHLAHYIGLGELDINQFVDKKSREKITEFFEENPGVGLSIAKEVLDNEITFSQLRFVRSHLDYLANQ